MSAEHPLNDRDIELLSAYLDDALSSEERAALDARLKAEAQLRRELAELRQTVALVHDFGRMRAPRNFTLSAAMARPPRILFFPATAAVSALSAVAAIVLVVAGTLLLTRSTNSTLSPLTSASVASTRQIAFAPTTTAVPSEVPLQDGLIAGLAATETRGDEDTQTSFGAFAGTTEAEAPTDLTLDRGATELREETDDFGYAARSAMPTQGAQGIEPLTQAQTQPESADQLGAAVANSAVEGNAADAADQAAPAAPMMAFAPPEGTPTAAELFSMQMAAPAPEESVESSGTGGGMPAGADASEKAIVEEPTATATDTATPSATPTLTATASPTLTPTATATATPSVTPSPTPTPSLPFTGSGDGIAGLLLIVAGAAALILSLAAYLIRRRA